MGLPSECRWNQKATSRPSRWSVSASILALPTQALPSPVAAAQEVALLGAFGLHPNQRSPAQAPGTLGLSRCTALAMPVHPGPWCRHIWEAANRCFSLSLPLSPPLCLKAMRKCPWVRILYIYIHICIYLYIYIYQFLLGLSKKASWNHRTV